MNEPTARLSDAFIDLFRLVAEFRTGRTDPTYDRLRDDIRALLARGEAAARDAGHAADDYREARYAVCAWIDESILDSRWEQRTRWQRELLQRELYQTSDAGERFFTRLAELDRSRRAVREIYYLCLLLGFKGRYAFDLPALDRLKASLLSSLFDGEGPPTLERCGLFNDPASAAAPSTTPAPRLSAARKILLAVPPAAVLLLWVVYRWTLSNVSDGILRVAWPQ